LAGKWKYVLRGSVSIVAGALFGYVAASDLFFHAGVTTVREAWFLAGFFLLAAAAVYFVWVGNNQLQRASGQQVKSPRLRWGRLLLGFTLVFAALKRHFAPEPTTLKADNEAQAAAMLSAVFVLVGVGVLLMVLAFRPPKEKPAENASTTNDTTGAF